MWWLFQWTCERGGWRLRYEGEFKAGMRHGHGVFVSKKGARYDGEWASSLRHGVGKESWPNGERVCPVVPSMCLRRIVRALVPLCVGGVPRVSPARLQGVWQVVWPRCGPSHG